MLKKIFTDTLISIFLDKDARKIFKSFKKSNLSKQVLTPTLTSIENTDSNAFPVSDSKEGSHLVSKDNIIHDETHQLIIDSLKAAELELIKNLKISDKRKSLISNALVIQNSKQYLLDELTEEQRSKLKALALSVFQLDLFSIETSNKGIEKKDERN